MTFSSRMRTFMMGDELDNGSRISGHCRALAPFPSERGAEGGGGGRKTAGCTLSKGLGDGNQRSNSTSGKHKNVSRTYLCDSHFPVYPTSVPPLKMLIARYLLWNSCASMSIKGKAKHPSCFSSSQNTVIHAFNRFPDFFLLRLVGRTLIGRPL